MTPDRQRIIKLEAENAALREELAAWQAFDQERQSSGSIQDRYRVHLIKCALKSTGKSPNGHGWAAKLILHLLEHPGRISARDELLGVITDNEDVQPRSVDVAASHARTGLAVLGVPKGIETVWGLGYRIDPAKADAIRQAVGLKADGLEHVSLPVGRVVSELASKVRGRAA